MEASPCIKVCTLNIDNICIGCGRTKDELDSWRSLDDLEKKAIKSKLSERLTNISLKLKDGNEK